jgi:hypothetical protein
VSFVPNKKEETPCFQICCPGNATIPVEDDFCVEEFDCIPDEHAAQLRSIAIKTPFLSQREYALGCDIYMAVPFFTQTLYATSTLL